MCLQIDCFLQSTLTPLIDSAAADCRAMARAGGGGRASHGAPPDTPTAFWKARSRPRNLLATCGHTASSDALVDVCCLVGGAHAIREVAADACSSVGAERARILVHFGPGAVGSTLLLGWRGFPPAAAELVRPLVKGADAAEGEPGKWARPQRVSVRVLAVTSCPSVRGSRSRSRPAGTARARRRPGRGSRSRRRPRASSAGW